MAIRCHGNAHSFFCALIIKHHIDLLVYACALLYDISLKPILLAIGRAVLAICYER
jgi:hypothetical protein